MENIHGISLGKKYIFPFLCLILFVTPSWCGNMRIFGLESKDKMEKDFIVVLKHKSNTTEHTVRLQEVEEFTKDLSPDDDDEAIIGQKYSFGKFAALRVHVTEEEVHRLSQHHDVDFIQANQKVRISQSAGACVGQNTGGELWGLSRLSSHSKPAYISAKYKYLEGMLFKLELSGTQI